MSPRMGESSVVDWKVRVISFGLFLTSWLMGWRSSFRERRVAFYHATTTCTNATGKFPLLLACWTELMVLQSRKQAHTDLLISFTSSYKFSAVLILTSVDSAAATTEDHLLSPLQVILPPSDLASKIPSDLAERLSRIPPYPPTPSTKPTYPPFLPNGGLARRLLATLQTNPEIPHGTLAYWCAEADNRPDAFRYAGIVTYLLGIRESALRCD